MFRESGRWFVVATLAVTMLLCVSGIAEAAWSATAGGPARAGVVLMPAGQPPTATRSGPTTNTVVTPRPVLFGTTRISTFTVYRSTNGGTETAVTLTGCTNQTTTRTCTDSGLSLEVLATYRYAVEPRHGTNWVGARSALSNPA